MFQDVVGIGHVSQRRDRHGLSGSLRGSRGRVLYSLYLAEDSLAIVRERVEGIARHRGLDARFGSDPCDHGFLCSSSIENRIAPNCSRRPGNFVPDSCCWIRW